MTTYRGETLEPEMASTEEAKIITKLEQISDAMKDLAEKHQKLLAKLPTRKPLVVEGDEGFRTYIVDTPKGHFVTYRELEFAMNTKTTKADLKALSEE